MKTDCIVLDPVLGSLMKINRASRVIVALLMGYHLVASTTLLAQPKETRRMVETPDLLQTDLEARFPGGGIQYCAPVSVSNSLMWLADHGYPKLVPKGNSGRRAQIDLVHLLGSADYMNTDLKVGTGITNLIRGVVLHLERSGYRFKSLSYQGWRKHHKKYATHVAVPELNWIRKGIIGRGVAWLNIGWYRYDPEVREYQRQSGHWVTLVGFFENSGEPNRSSAFVIHDPSPRGGLQPTNHFVEFERLEGGKLVGKNEGLPRSATGYLRLTRGLPVNEEYNVGILDGVVLLEMP